VLRQDKELGLTISETKTQSAFVKVATLKLSYDEPLAEFSNPLPMSISPETIG
jgi:hypothetical protein